MGCQKKSLGTKVVPVAASAPQEKVSTASVDDADGLAPALYYVPVVDVKNLNCEADKVQTVKNVRGEPIAQVCSEAYKSCLKQGTCLLNQANGLRLISFTTRRDTIPLFSDQLKRECPYGLGLKDICLDPYHTVAANLNHYNLGDVIYVPSISGVKLPDGEIHDGYFIVRDSGTNLKTEKRFDFFTGFDRNDSNEFKRLGFEDFNNRFKFEIASQDKSNEIRKLRNYPKLNSKQLSLARAAVFKNIKNN